jgi:hypothetical protein
MRDETATKLVRVGYPSSQSRSLIRCATWGGSLIGQGQCPDPWGHRDWRSRHSRSCGGHSRIGLA